MVYAGEDPRFIFRRMLIFCGEDAGLADPNALTVVQAAADAFDRVGMPEGRYHLAMATLHLATAPKSNSTFAFFDALNAVEKEAEAEVPTHLKDDHRDSEGFGHGAGYLYPHAYRNHWVAQQYLPSFLKGRVFYQPGEVGHEGKIAEQVHQRRELQLAKALDPGAHGAPPEILTFSPSDRHTEEWLDRTGNNASGQLGELREKLFAHAQCRRHELVLDLSGDSGIYTWEALRQVPEGGVWSLVRNAEAGEAIQNRAQTLPELRRPHVVVGTVEQLRQSLQQGGHGDVRFDVITGRSLFTRCENRLEILSEIRDLLTDQGRICLVEPVPRCAQRLYDLVHTSGLELDAGFLEKWREAEETIYSDERDPMVNWDSDLVQELIQQAGFLEPRIEEVEQHADCTINARMISRWFESTSGSGRRSYAERLSDRLTEDDLATVKSLFERQLKGKSVQWRTFFLIVHAVRQ